MRGLLGKKTCVVWETNEHEMQPCLRVGFSLCMSSHISIPNNQRTAQLSGQNTFCCGHTGPWGCTAGMARTCVSDNAVATASASTSEILALGAQWPNLQTRNVQPIQQREIESPSKTISHLGPRLANLNRLPLHWQQQHLATGRPLQKCCFCFLTN